MSEPYCTPPKKLTQERFVNLFSTEICTEKGRNPWIFASRKKEPGACVKCADAAARALDSMQSARGMLYL
jgi:hypothetical protein